METDELSIYKPKLSGRGSSRTVLQLAKAFNDRGWDVDLTLAKATGELKPRIPEGINVIDFDVDLRYPKTVTAMPEMMRYLKSEQPPVMISMTGGANVVPLIARRLTGVRTRIIAKGGVKTRRDSLKNGDWRGFVMSNLVRWTYPWADRIVMGEQNSADNLTTMIPEISEKTSIIHQPVITQEIKEKMHESLDHPWFNSDEIPVILGAQRLDQSKDFSTLIRAFGHFRDQRDGRLVILGEGEEREHLESLVSHLGLEDHVSLPGFVKNPYKYMSRADLFVLSSKNDTLPNALIEAMASGCPVVATDCPPGGVATILEDGKWGELVPVGEPKRMASAMTEAINNPVEGAKERACYFSLENSVDSFVDVISQL